MQAFNQNGEGGQGGDQGCVQGGFQVGAQGDGQGGGRGDGQGDGQEGGSHSSCAILQLQPEQMQGLTKIVFSWVICDDDQKVEVSAYNSAT